ncbi:MAG: glycosyltransferase family 2 protein, partial [Woeseiaceae bacterium]
MHGLNEGMTNKVTVIIPNWNGMEWLEGCLQSLGNQTLRGFETLIVDNGSTDGSLEFIDANYPQVTVIRLDRNTGFANAANVGIRESKTPYVALLNTDTRVYPDWLSNLLQRMEDSPPDVAAINPQILKMDDPDQLDDAGDELTWYGLAMKTGHGQPAKNFGEETEVFSPCAGASLYRRDFLQHTGGFDASFFAYLEDVDLGFRGRLMGYRYLYLPSAKVLHKSHGSNLPQAKYIELTMRNRLMLFAKNVPLSLLLRRAPKLIYGQWYFLVAQGRPLAAFKG